MYVILIMYIYNEWTDGAEELGGWGGQRGSVQTGDQDGGGGQQDAQQQQLVLGSSAPSQQPAAPHTHLSVRFIILVIYSMSLSPSTTIYIYIFIQWEKKKIHKTTKINRT